MKKICFKVGEPTLDSTNSGFVENTWDKRLHMGILYAYQTWPSEVGWKNLDAKTSEKGMYVSGFTTFWNKRCVVAAFSKDSGPINQFYFPLDQFNEDKQ